jgi:hypothetical protein
LCFDAYKLDGSAVLHGQQVPVKPANGIDCE